MTDSLYKEYSDFIRQNAESEEVIAALVNLAKSDQISRKWARGLYSLESHRDFFNNEDYLKILEQSKSQLIGFAMAEQVNTENYEYIDYLATKLAPSDTGYVFVNNIIALNINSRQWDKAINQLNMYEHLYPAHKDKIDDLKTILSKPIEGLEPVPVNGINSPGGEWDPNPTSDGKYIFYSKRQVLSNNADVALGQMSDSGFVEIGLLKGPLSGPYDETVDNISYGADKIFLSGTLEGTFGKFDIFFGERTGSEYSEITHLPKPVNSEYTDEGATMSVDGKVMVFTSDRPYKDKPYRPYGSLYMGHLNGDMDIYVTKKNEGGGWSDPINIGMPVNTNMSERSPFLHPDGKTLYFSSNGHATLGQLDVYKTTRLDDTWQNWSEPVNLGKEINTISDDWGYKVSLNGEKAYFSALNRSIGKGGYDIFYINLPSAARPDSLIIVSGEIKDKRTGKPVRAEVRWEIRQTGGLQGSLETIDEQSSFKLPLKRGNEYGYYVTADGYLPYSASLTLPENYKKNEMDMVINLVSIPKKQGEVSKLTASNIIFDYDSYEVKEASYTEITNIADLMNSIPDIKLRIEGHTDEEGTKEYNQRLSEKRAKAVKDLLVKFGVADSRLSYLGFGEEKPITTNINKSRRVEFIFINE
jgi:outer membrane protein OmpA-like peptidoglycan-associated protein